MRGAGAPAAEAGAGEGAGPWCPGRPAGQAYRGGLGRGFCWGGFGEFRTGAEAEVDHEPGNPSTPILVSLFLVSLFFILFFGGVAACMGPLRGDR